MASKPRSRSLPYRLGHAVLGYPDGVHVPQTWRILLATGFLAALALVFLAARGVLRREPPADLSPDVRVLARLDDFTKDAGVKVKNSIPAFLHRPGTLGVLVGGSEPDSETTRSPIPRQAIGSLNESDLLQGYCSASVPSLIRQRYPGSYDEMSDAELQRKVLAKYPEYRDKLCVLPPWLNATPHDIVKYELSQVAEVTDRRPWWLWAGLVTLGFAFATLNVYYRLLAPRFGSGS